MNSKGIDNYIFFQIGTTLYSNISVTDKDIGLNAELVITCVKSDACGSFSIYTEKVFHIINCTSLVSR